MEYLGQLKNDTVKIVHVATGEVFYSWADAQVHEAKNKNK